MTKNFETVHNIIDFFFFLFFRERSHKHNKHILQLVPAQQYKMQTFEVLRRICKVFGGGGTLRKTSLGGQGRNCCLCIMTGRFGRVQKVTHVGICTKDMSSYVFPKQSYCGSQTLFFLPVHIVSVGDHPYRLLITVGNTVFAVQLPALNR